MGHFICILMLILDRNCMPACFHQQYLDTELSKSIQLTQLLYHSEVIHVLYCSDLATMRTYVAKHFD